MISQSSTLATTPWGLLTKKSIYNNKKENNKNKNKNKNNDNNNKISKNMKKNNSMNTSSEKLARLHIRQPGHG